MNYSFINNLSSKQLKDLEKVIKDDELRGGFLKHIEQAISLKERNINNNGLFCVETIPYYDKNLEDKCLNILESLSIEQFYFLTRSFREKGNGESLYANSGVQDYLADCFDISVNKMMYALENPRIYGFNMNLSAFEKFFSEESLNKRFKNSFNIYNYVKSYIYQCLKSNSEIDSKTLFIDYGRKQIIVERDLQKVAAFLYQIRGDGEARCSIANQGLSRTAKKVSGQITFNQQRLIEAVAFGTTMEKLNAGNYEDSKKLIYLP